MSERPADRHDGTDEAHLAAVLAVLTLVRADETAQGTPLQQWRARRLAAITHSGTVTQFRNEHRTA
jgi:hypothetical protein